MTTVDEELTCAQEACPFPDGCLEGFPNFADCPHTSLESDEDADDETDAASESDTEADQGEVQGAPTSVRPVDLAGADALTLDEGGRLMAKQRCTVVLIAGEAKAGKTTLVVELYARFLFGPYGAWKFAESHTLRALDVRHFTALQASGNAEPFTERTADEDMRLLHLSLAGDGERRSLLFSDVRGEFFDEVIEGTPVAERVELAQRADRCIITIDGDRLAEPGAAESAFMRARMLLGGLMEEGGIEADTPIAVVCTKWDKVEPTQRPSILERAQNLAKHAASAGRQTHVFPVSVRPGPDIEGLPELLEWLTTRVGEDPKPSGETFDETGRHFWRGERGASGGR